MKTPPGRRVGCLSSIFVVAALAFRVATASAQVTAAPAPVPKPTAESSGSYTELSAPNGDALQFGFHGYFRAPALLTIRERSEADKRPNDKGDYDYRPPRLIDNDFYRSRFAYLPVNETAWAEVFLSAGNEYATGTVALAAGDYSDSSFSGLISPNAQKGIFQGFVTLRYAPAVGEVPIHLRLKAGAFWERFGYLPKYDTYIFSRIHMTGASLESDASFGRLRTGLTLGAGYHYSESVAKEGLTNALYGVASASWDKTIFGGLYYIYAFAQDKAAMGTPPDASQEVAGVDARLDLPFLGDLRGAFSMVSIEQPESLAGVLEVMHTEKAVRYETYVGQGFTKAKTMNLALQADLSARRIATAIAGQTAPPGRQSDLTLSLFNLYLKVNESDATPPATPDPFSTLWLGRQGRRFSKWGAELNARALPWFGVSVRYDHVNLDLDAEDAQFTAVSPRVSFYPALGFGSDAQIFFQYTRYSYGDGMTTSLQPTTSMTLGRWFDTDVFKIQAQMNF